MRITKQTGDTLTLTLSIILALSMITLLYINLAITDANSPPQAAIGGAAVEYAESQPQAPAPAAVETQQPNQEAQPTAPPAPELQEENVQTDEAAGTNPESATANFIPTLIVIVGIVLSAGAVGYFLFRFIKARGEDAELEDESDAGLEEPDGDERAGESRTHILTSIIQRLRGKSMELQDDETVDLVELHDVEEDNEVESVGIDELDDIDEMSELEEQDEANILELCYEIERLTDKVNDYAEKMKEHASRTGLMIPQELVAIEESDELPGEADGLQQEVIRLKKRINAQVDYIEEMLKNQGVNEEKADNNGNKEPFLVFVANALSNMQKEELVYKPQRQRGNNDYTYVPSAEFFDILSKTMPDYKKKNIVEALKQHDIIDCSANGYDTVYNKKRVLKVYSKQFVLLTTEFAEDVGA